MTIETRYTLIGLTAGLAIWGLAESLVWLLHQIVNKSGPNSPIKVVGGSLKLKAKKGWHAGTNCKVSPCSVSVGTTDTTELNIDANQLSQLQSWVLTINFSKDDGSSVGTGGIVIHPSDSNGACVLDQTLCKAGASTNIASYTLAPAATYLIPDSHDLGGAVFKRYRYRNPNCCNAQAPDYSESFYSARVDYILQGVAGVKTLPYTCAKDGECEVDFGPER